MNRDMNSALPSLLPSQRKTYGIGVTSILLIVATIGALISLYLSTLFQSGSIDVLDYKGRVAQILRSTPLIDGHNDLPYLLRIELQNKIYDTMEFNFWDGNDISAYIAREFP